MISIAQSAAFELLMLIQNGFGSVDMHSPYRQICHILGIALTSRERVHSTPITKEQWQKAKGINTSIFDRYALQYFHRPSENQSSLDEESHRSQITMCMFLQYLGGPPMRSEIQLRSRILSLYVPYDNILQSKLGFSASHLLRVLDFIRDTHQQQFDCLATTHRCASACHKQFIARWDAENWSLEQMRDEAVLDPVGGATTEFVSAMRELWLLKRDSLYQAIGVDIADCIIACLGVERGLDASAYKYATDPSPAVQHPLILLEDNAIFCASHSFLYYAAELHFDIVLSRCESSRRFYETRDRWMEQRVADNLEGFLGDSGTVWRNVCETSTAQYEHDIVAKVGNSWIVVEVKAAPVRRSFFDPDKAYVRIRDDFHNDSGIQKAFEQGERLKQLLLSTDHLRLFNTAGCVVINSPVIVEEVFVICVTGEYWGQVAIDLSLLLEKDEASAYPWAACVDDFETFLGGLKARGKSPNDFIEFLRQRAKLHGRFFSEDELNIGGYFIDHGVLPTSVSPNSMVMFTPENSSIFDEIFFESQGTPINRDRENEFNKYLHGLHESTEQISSCLGIDSAPILHSLMPHIEPLPRRKIGRNAPCPCGSGLKYKRCCGI